MLDSQLQQINNYAKRSLEATNAIYWSGSLENARTRMDDYYDFAHPGFKTMLQV